MVITKNVHCTALPNGLNEEIDQIVSRVLGIFITGKWTEMILYLLFSVTLRSEYVFKTNFSLKIENVMWCFSQAVIIGYLCSSYY